jgi:hypothetical protein
MAFTSHDATEETPDMPLIVHHLNNSRSQRILWLLEELGLDYEIKHYTRDSVTNLAPPELRAIHHSENRRFWWMTAR